MTQGRFSGHPSGICFRLLVGIEENCDDGCSGVPTLRAACTKEGAHVQVWLASTRNKKYGARRDLSLLE